MINEPPLRADTKTFERPESSEYFVLINKCPRNVLLFGHSGEPRHNLESQSPVTYFLALDSFSQFHYQPTKSILTYDSRYFFITMTIKMPVPSVIFIQAIPKALNDGKDAGNQSNMTSYDCQDEGLDELTITFLMRHEEKKHQPTEAQQSSSSSTASLTIISDMDSQRRSSSANNINSNRTKLKRTRRLGF